MLPKTKSTKEVLLSFPAIKKTAETFPIPQGAFEDPAALIAWSKTARCGDSEKHVVRFVATLMNQCRAVSDENRFDFFEAVTKWDDAQRAALKNWCTAAL